MMRSILSLPVAILLLAACQTTESEQSASASSMPEATASADGSAVADERTAAADSESMEQAKAIVTEFRYPGTTEGSAGRLVVKGNSATYHDTYCDGRSNSTGVVEGTTIDFDRMTYPTCDSSTPLWADVVVKGYDRATGCFQRLTFTWGYDRIERYNAYPTASECRTG